MTITNRVALPAGSASERTESLRSCRPTEKGPGPDHNGTSHALYRLDASIRVDGSHSRAVADIVDNSVMAGATLWGARTRSWVLTWPSMHFAHIR